MRGAHFGAALLLCATVLLSACTSTEKNARENSARADARIAAPPAEAPAEARAPSREGHFPGTGNFVRAAESHDARAGGKRPGAAAGTQTGAGGEITLNYADADIRQVMRDVLGDLLHVNYVLDPKVQGTVTLVTGRALSRDALLPVLETALRASGFSLAQRGDLYRVQPLDEVAKGSQPVISPGEPRIGPGVRILPLKFASAGQLQQVLQPFVSPGGAIQADGARNVLIVSGARQDLDSFTDLVNMFDVDWIAGTSYGIYPLKVGNSRTIATELEDILAESPDAPLSRLLRIIPLERLNSILVISSQPGYLNHAREWIERLDYGNDETTPKLFHYYVQNTRATDLANVLTELMSSGGGRAAPQFRTAPGTAATAIGGRGGAGSAPADTDGAVSTRSSGSLPPPPLRASLPVADAQSGKAAGAVGRPASSASNTPRRSDSLRQRAEPGGDGLEMPQVRVVADEKNNSLVIYARPREYQMIEDVIRKLDVVPLQVMIEATIAEVTLSDDMRFGLQFFLRSGANRVALTGTGSSTPGQIFPGFNYVLAGGSAQAVLSALSSVSDVNVISSPQLLVLDHQTAVLQVGDQVPVPVQQSRSVLTSDAPVVNSIEFRDTGVILQVTPRVNSSGLVTLDIAQEVSDVAQTTSSSINAPTIQQRRIVSTVVVEDGETVALGGLIKDNKNDTRSGIPILSDIPVAGALFRTTTKTKSRTELLVLLSPRVVRNAKEAQDVTDEIRARMQAIRPIDVKAH